MLIYNLAPLPYKI